MSAFICELETIHRAAGILANDGRGTDTDAATAYGRDLMKANRQAVRERYSHRPDVDNDMGCWTDDEVAGYTFDYRHGPRYDDKLPQWCRSLKSMECLLYQMSEGKVPETIIYKTLADAIARMRAKIVCSLPEYDAAEWG